MIKYFKDRQPSLLLRQKSSLHSTPGRSKIYSNDDRIERWFLVEDSEYEKIYGNDAEKVILTEPEEVEQGKKKCCQQKSL